MKDGRDLFSNKKIGYKKYLKSMINKRKDIYLLKI
jgi:hypothetical protein